MPSGPEDARTESNEKTKNYAPLASYGGERGVRVDYPKRT